MQILTDAETLASLIDSPEPPSAEDLAGYLAMLAERGEAGHDLAEPTPAELLVPPIEPEDQGADGEPWWSSLPTDPELDTPYGLGPAAEPVEVLGVRFRVMVAQRSDGDHWTGYDVIDSRLGIAVRSARWLAEAQAIAAELERSAPRSRSSAHSPERDRRGCREC